MLMISNPKLHLKFTDFKSQPHLPGGHVLSKRVALEKVRRTHPQWAQVQPFRISTKKQRPSSKTSASKVDITLAVDIKMNKPDIWHHKCVKRYMAWMCGDHLFIVTYALILSIKKWGNVLPWQIVTHSITFYFQYLYPHCFNYGNKYWNVTLRHINTLPHQSLQGSWFFLKYCEWLQGFAQIYAVRDSIVLLFLWL